MLLTAQIVPQGNQLIESLEFAVHAECHEYSIALHVALHTESSVVTY